MDTAEQKGISIQEGRGGVLGVKAGMTQVFDSIGNAIAVTVIELRQNLITQVKTKERDRYVALQVGIDPKKEKNVSKPEKGRAMKAGQPGFRAYTEFRLKDDSKVDGYTVGQALTAEFLSVGDLIDLTAISKGKGFQGVMKKYHYAGGMASHGASVSHRQIGSIGNRADPGKVFKGKRMPGQMGNVKTTIQNVKVVQIDLEKGILLVNGSVPGPKSGIVRIRKAVKTPKKSMKAGE